MLIASDVLVENFIAAIGGDNMATLYREACGKIDESVISGDFINNLVDEAKGSDAVE